MPDALVENWEPLVPTVTQNLKDFPPIDLPSPLLVQSADVFLLDSLDHYPQAVLTTVRAVSNRTGRTGPTLSPHHVFAAIHEAPKFAPQAGPLLD